MNAWTIIMTAPDGFCRVSLHTTIEGAERAACQEIAEYADARGMDAEIVKAAKAGDYQDARRRLYGSIAGSIEITSLPVHTTTPLMGPRMIESEEHTAGDTSADAQDRSACIARVCTRALGVGGIGLDGDLLCAVDVAIRTAVVDHLSRKS